MTELTTASGFEELVAPLRQELHAHCYRMLGSPHDADDAVQETLAKAWRAAGGFEGRSSVRTWLYTVATRSCLDAVRARGRRALPVDVGPAAPATVLADVARTDVAWLEPYPGPAAAYERRETVELAFVAALQHLPGNQRAALLLFDVVGLSAAEIADAMQTTTASVTSALQRARAVVADRVPAGRSRAAGDAGDAGEVRTRALAADLADALEHGDTQRFVELLSDDVTWAMPPLPGWYAGIAAVTDFARQVPFGACGSWRARPVVANGGPAFALWLRPPGGDTYDAWSINVVQRRGDRATAITSFLDPAQFGRFGLPSSL